jgi:hypothetical protein
MIKNLLTIKILSINFPAFRNNSGFSAPSTRDFGFKEKTNISRDSQTREDWAVAVVTGTNLGIFICSKTTEVNMSNQNACLKGAMCPNELTPYDYLVQQFQILSLNVVAAEYLLSDSQSGYPQRYGAGLVFSFSEFETALNNYLAKHNDLLIQ